MGLRFRKRFNLGGGLHLNLGKKSSGLSFGTKGARVSLNSKGRVTGTVGAPGTGVFYQKSTSLNKKKAASRNVSASHENQWETGTTTAVTPPTTGGFILLGALLGALLALPGLALLFLPWTWVRVVGVVLLLLGGETIFKSRREAKRLRALTDQAETEFEPLKEDVL